MYNCKVAAVLSLAIFPIIISYFLYSSNNSGKRLLSLFPAIKCSHSLFAGLDGLQDEQGHAAHQVAQGALHAEADGDAGGGEDGDPITVSIFVCE